MGRVIVEQIVSADGFAASPDGGIDWFQSAGDWSEMAPEQIEMLEDADAVVLGANTYRMFSAYWPTADPEVEEAARYVNTLPKHVFSSTLDEVPWGDHEPAILERGDAVQTVRRLTEQYAGDIVIWGSLTLTEALFAAGVVDILRLRVIPVLIGDGIRVAPASLSTTPLGLQASHSYPRGHVTMTYTLGAS